MRDSPRRRWTRGHILFAHVTCQECGHYLCHQEWHPYLKPIFHGTKHCPFPFQPTNLRRQSNPGFRRTINLLNFNECACSVWYFGAGFTQTFFDLIKDSYNQWMQTKLWGNQELFQLNQIFGIFQIIPHRDFGSGGEADQSFSLSRANRILSTFGHRLNEFWTLSWADYQSSVLLLLVFVLQAVFSIYSDKPTW